MPETEQNLETCITCGKQKRRLKGMSITQWIFSADFCKCDMDFKPDELEVQYCKSCKNRIVNTRKGSLTQWIFVDTGPICNCPEPLIDSPLNDIEQNVKTIEEQKEEIDPILIGELPIAGNRYLPQKLIAVGNSRVYKCWDDMLNRNVAVKILTKSNWSEQTLIWFQNEARLTSKLIHPGIVEIYDFGIDDNDEPYMVIEYIDAITLANLISQNGPLPADLIIEIALQVSEALIYAHEREVFHRDLTPSNIMLVESENDKPRVKVIDFGIATMNNEEESYKYQGLTVAGTPLYMSPDQLKGLKYDARSEIYSLGCVLFEALTGKPPFAADDTMGILACHANSQPPSLGDIAPELHFSPILESFIGRCLEKEPENRFEDMSTFKEELINLQNLDLSERERERALTGEYTLEKQTRLKNAKTSSIPSLLVVLAIATCTGGAVLAYLIFSGNQSAVKKVKEKTPSSQRKIETGTEMIEGFKIAGLKSIEINDQSLVHYRNESKIKKLDLSGGTVTDAGLDNIIHLPLYQLNASATKITDAGLKKISTIKTLNILNLSDNNQLTPVSYSYLKNLPELYRLSASSNNINHQSLKHICDIKTLKFLGLARNNEIGGSDLEELKRLPQLESLYLVKVQFKKDGIDAIAKLDNLISLCLGSTNITDEDLVKLSKLKSLEELELSNTDVSDKGILSLAGLKSLKYLTMVDCKNVSKDLKYKLLQLMPGCQVNDHGMYKGF